MEHHHGGLEDHFPLYTWVMVRFHVNFPGCSGWKTSLTFWNGPFLPDILVFWESNLKRKPFQIGSTSYREIHGPLVLSLISTVFTHRSRAHVRLLLGSCIVAQTMVLDEPNWRDWTEAHICHVVTVEMVHHLKCQICRFTWKKIRTMWLGLLLFQLKKYVRQIHVWLFLTSPTMFDATMFKGWNLDKFNMCRWHSRNAKKNASHFGFHSSLDIPTFLFHQSYRIALEALYFSVVTLATIGYGAACWHNSGFPTPNPFKEKGARKR